ncbi:hypothetical protein POJ06DRAFT_266859 [Lipomyces tetrasporus]|uniref:Nonsense-mediated mRNA decay factor n=1 Tax=Lipomyces tetrasporus TaxID=54092 RepID=A0AAD7VUV8_9ASCO|nr:uncharacterized protein POJ06DRAFT_266859 [Lipomyces tetrasporus]KAJ8102249.1 hypothetical protein POJ06DRAFT_266859 [Lipomyces tetrasporus]
MSTNSLPGEIVVLEKKLKTLLKVRPPYHKDVDTLVTEFRETVERIILQDITAAHAADLDTVLWIRVHHPVIELYKKLLQKIQPQIKAKPTEARKLQDFFVKFLKSAAQFYRLYIQHLVGQFGVREIEPIVVRFHMEAIRSPRALKKPNDKLRILVVRSCHRALVCLGDLSRYREMHSFDSAEKEWRHAQNYYILAKQLYPSLGFPHNQLAVISIFEGSVLSSQYHFYRAICVKEPFPTAEGNLGLGFKKFMNSPKIAKADGSQKRDENAVNQLLESFLIWHAIAYKTGRAPGDDTLEIHILQQLRADIVDRKVTTDTLTKMVLINICAYYKAMQDPTREDLATEMLKFNVAMLSCLLKVLNGELEAVRSNATPLDIQTEGISAVARRVLYGLRIYSAWLMVNAQSMTRANNDGEQIPMLSAQVSDLWTDYADALSSIAVLFGNLNLEKTDVLLKEDIDLIGCEPLNGGFHGIRARAEELTFAEIEEVTSRLHPMEETLLRISDLLTDAVTLSNREEVPLVFEEEKFTYYPLRIMSTPAGTGAVPLPEFSSQSFYSMNQSQLERSQAKSDPAITAFGEKRSVAGSVGSEPSVSYMMNAMVDYLVQDDELESVRRAKAVEPAGRTNLDEVVFARSRRAKKDANPKAENVPADVPDLSSQQPRAFSPWNPLATSTQALPHYAAPNPSTFSPFSDDGFHPGSNAFQFSNQGFDPFAASIGIQHSVSASTFARSPVVSSAIGGDVLNSFSVFQPSSVPSSVNELDPSFQAMSVKTSLPEPAVQQLRNSTSTSSFDSSRGPPSATVQPGQVRFFPPQVRLHKSIGATSKRASISPIERVSSSSPSRHEPSPLQQNNGAGRWYSEPARRLDENRSRDT